MPAPTLALATSALATFILALAASTLATSILVIATSTLAWPGPL